MLIVAGGLHIFFYTLKKQNNNLKYDSRVISKGKQFTFNYCKDIKIFFWIFMIFLKKK